MPKTSFKEIRTLQNSTSVTLHIKLKSCYSTYKNNIGLKSVNMTTVLVYQKQYTTALENIQMQAMSQVVSGTVENSGSPYSEVYKVKRGHD